MIYKCKESCKESVAKLEALAAEVQCKKCKAMLSTCECPCGSREFKLIKAVPDQPEPNHYNPIDAGRPDFFTRRGRAR